MTLALWISTPLTAATLAQSITAAPDGTGTQISVTGSQISIGGGSQRGNNLFHSFTDFGLDAQQTAIFEGNPSLANILGRVSGGQVSVIDGLIQVSNSQAHLYLMNPAGLIFGPNARLDLAGPFTATTATALGFDRGWWPAQGSAATDSLVGSPNRFAFVGSQPGAIVNAGDLAVVPGAALTLLGGTVVNTGHLRAPGGAITLMAVPGESLVRVQQQGMILGLDLEPLSGSSTDALVLSPFPSTILDLPQLLTGGHLGHATHLEVTPTGTVRLSSTAPSSSPDRVPDRPGATTVIAGTLDVSSPHSSAPGGESGGTLQVLGQEVGVGDRAQLRADGAGGGGRILVGGDYQGQGSVPSAHHTTIRPGAQISANALTQGNGGQVIIWADNQTEFGGSIAAIGGVLGGNGGFVEV
ncbi:filamentous hemagglutinin N-terminal domain-containing protein [Prochlorothrix hollandica]|uniref:Filamentous haemagglutinin FhaB/tRNA nuclease CdiA-like TPS domain-containing protein n=1 Tax=Prochlorothrix hollandica PCC 9006 = CALU 1027 TaxID=317619 RepID=A0A0M2PVZ6_PROHO|nr:filamentous hemagglutinin N-terminal domain-containing protein [Prochlorothrix hollandica]KKI98546.1 hypothetical protein PROH_16705 [Prochlorothrix hollandica PCC 9006 = CALU 1027]